jgi:hypothetical protein
MALRCITRRMVVLYATVLLLYTCMTCVTYVSCVGRVSLAPHEAEQADIILTEHVFRAMATQSVARRQKNDKDKDTLLPGSRQMNPQNTDTDTDMISLVETQSTLGSDQKFISDLIDRVKSLVKKFSGGGGDAGDKGKGKGSGSGGAKKSTQSRRKQSDDKGRVGGDRGYERENSEQLSAEEKRQLPLLPSVYNSKPSEWGCCRLCMNKAASSPPAQRTIDIQDPARRVNCCPVCPWPQRDVRTIGPYLYYYQKHQGPRQDDLYEEQLHSYANAHIGKKAYSHERARKFAAKEFAKDAKAMGKDIHHDIIYRKLNDVLGTPPGAPAPEGASPVPAAAAAAGVKDLNDVLVGPAPSPSPSPSSAVDALAAGSAGVAQQSGGQMTGSFIETMFSKLPVTHQRAVLNVLESEKRVLNVALAEEYARVRDGRSKTTERLVALHTRHQFIGDLWNSAKKGVSNAINTAKQVAGNAVNSVKSTIGNAVNKVKAGASHVWNTAKSAAKGVVDKVKGTVSSLRAKFENMISGSKATSGGTASTSKSAKRDGASKAAQALTAARNLPQPSRDEKEPDPFANMRGDEMERAMNYVYGFPGKTELSDAPPKRDLPPCCTVCNAASDTLSGDADTGCCVQCDRSYSARAPFYERKDPRAHAADEWTHGVQEPGVDEQRTRKRKRGE